eukprot:jgi/Mesen1/5000/ME000025S04400
MGKRAKVSCLQACLVILVLSTQWGEALEAREEDTERGLGFADISLHSSFLPGSREASSHPYLPSHGLSGASRNSTGVPTASGAVSTGPLPASTAHSDPPQRPASVPVPVPGRSEGAAMAAVGSEEGAMASGEQGLQQHLSSHGGRDAPPGQQHSGEAEGGEAGPASSDEAGGSVKGGGRRLTAAPKKAPVRKAPAGPTCSGPCCSNKAPVIPVGTPTLASRWWSSQMAHGAQIQLRANTWSTWVLPKDGVSWKTSVLFAASANAPPVTSFFTVFRVSSTQVILQTPAKTYVRAGGPRPELTQVEGYGAMDFTTDYTDPKNVLTIEPAGGTYAAFQVHIKCYDGLYLSSHDGAILRWATVASSWETWDVREVMRVPSMRGPNIGAWLVYEWWMDPSYYPNPSDWKDGTSVTLQSLKYARYVSAVGGGGGLVKCNVTGTPGPAQTFNILRQNYTAGYFQFRTQSANLWSLASGRSQLIVANRQVPAGKGQENFHVYFSPSDPAVVAIRAPNQRFLRAGRDGQLVADVPPGRINLKSSAKWGEAAFRIADTHAINGEWQLAQQLGKRATSAMQARARSFLTEADFAYFRAQRINTIRIPVGYWVALGARAPDPFPKNDALALDWAFQMGAKYGVRIFVGIHAAPASQNGWDHSATRDGFPLWGSNATNVQTLVDAVAWLAQRYGASSAFMGIGLMNEPVVSDTMPLAVPN